jgi:hypothetical protein
MSVFANMMEISGKAQKHKVMASMPDVCLSPPSPPAGPIPIPYPNFALASDVTGGTRTVKIGGKEVSMQDKSSYKKSTGDEAATKSFGAGVISHNINGPVKHKVGSFDVKVEGSPVSRHLDLTTGNHVNAGDGCTTVDGATPAPKEPDPECAALHEENEKTRAALKKASRRVSRSKRKKIMGGRKGRGTTVASMSNGKSAHNSQQAFMAMRSLEPGGTRSLVDDPTKKYKPINDPKRIGEETPLCKGSKYKPPGVPEGAVQKSGHSEARLMSGLNGATGKKLLINIDWRPGSGGTSKMPCPECHRMLCASAAKPKCNNDITLCDDKGQKHSLKEYCPATNDSYADLKSAMGED